MRRITLLCLALLFCMAQKGDAPLHIKAFVCEKSGNDYCGRRLRSGFEPARIRLEAYVRQIPEATDMQYGLVCADEDAPRASSVVDLSGRMGPMYFVEHRDIEAGHCWGVAIVYRRDQKPLVARSEPILILIRD